MGLRARIAAVSVLAVALAVGGLAAPPLAGTAFARRSATWQLVDYDQTACYSTNVHEAWFGVYIEGRWRRSIDVGADQLPPGGTYTTSYAPIPPGSSTGEYSLAYVGVTLPSTEPVGTYTARLWASTGRIRQSVPITLVVQDRCGY